MLLFPRGGASSQAGSPVPPQSLTVTWSHSWGQTLRKFPPRGTHSPDGHIYLSQHPLTLHRSERKEGEEEEDSLLWHLPCRGTEGHGPDQPAPRGPSGRAWPWPRRCRPGTQHCPRGFPTPCPHLCKQTPHSTLIPAERAICFLRGSCHAHAFRCRLPTRQRDMWPVARPLGPTP